MRATRVETDLGFVELIVLLQHREKWQNIGAVLSSKAVVQQFCLELQKKMNMRYVSPPLPVNMTMVQPQQQKGTRDSDLSALYPIAAQQAILSTDGVTSAGERSAPGETGGAGQGTEQEDVSASIFALFEGK